MSENTFTVRCLDAFLNQNHYWIFLELMDKGSFTPLCEGLMGNISEEAIKYSLYMTLKGINELHTRNIIHRDIKSDNILVTSQGEIKLADFGFAVMLTEEY